MEKALTTANQALSVIREGAADLNEQLKVLALIAKMLNPGLNITYDQQVGEIYSAIRP